MDYKLAVERPFREQSGQQKFRLLNARQRKFLSYYGPYKRLFAADMACALVVSATTLLIPPTHHVEFDDRRLIHFRAGQA